MADWYFKQGDNAPPINQTLLDVNGDPADIASATVKFAMRSVRDLRTVIYATAVNDQTVDPATKGKVHYDWQSGQLDAPGGYYGEWEVTFAGGKRETFPSNGYVRIAIMADVGNVVPT